jgi:hypothetical protein
MDMTASMASVDSRVGRAVDITLFEGLVYLHAHDLFLNVHLHQQVLQVL